MGSQTPPRTHTHTHTHTHFCHGSLCTQVQRELERAQEQDPSIFQYDEVCVLQRALISPILVCCLTCAADTVLLSSLSLSASAFLCSQVYDEMSAARAKADPRFERYQHGQKKEVRFFLNLSHSHTDNDQYKDQPRQRPKATKLGLASVLCVNGVTYSRHLPPSPPPLTLPRSLSACLPVDTVLTWQAKYVTQLLRAAKERKRRDDARQERAVRSSCCWWRWR